MTPLSLEATFARPSARAQAGAAVRAVAPRLGAWAHVALLPVVPHAVKRPFVTVAVVTVAVPLPPLTARGAVAVRGLAPLPA